VGLELEDEARDVCQDQDDGDVEADRLDVLGLAMMGDRCVDRGDDEGDHRQEHHAAARFRRHLIEAQLLVLPPPEQHGETEDHQHVANDRPGERGLHDRRFARTKGHEPDDELGRVAERRVEEPAHSRPSVVREVLGGLAHEASQRQDRETGDHEDGGRRGVGEPEPEGHRYEDEEGVEDPLAVHGAPPARG
jgi:hypothetical protein